MIACGPVALSRRQTLLVTFSHVVAVCVVARRPPHDTTKNEGRQEQLNMARTAFSHPAAMHRSIDAPGRGEAVESRYE